MMAHTNGADTGAPTQAGLPLRSNDELFAGLIENAFDSIVIANTDGTICYANSAIERVLGYRPAELIGVDLTSIIHPDDVSAVAEFFQQAQAMQAAPNGISPPLLIETRVRDQGGAWRALESALKVLDTPALSGIVVNSRDITERKWLERLRNAQNRVLELMATDASLHEVLETLVLMIEAESPGMLASVLLLDDDGRHVHHVVAPNLPPEYCCAVDGLAIGPQAGSCGTALYRREPVIVSDIAHDPLWDQYRDLAARHGLRACWSNPIFSHRREVLGTFAMYFREPRSPTLAEGRLIELATRMAGIAIERKRVELRFHYLAYHDLLTGLPNRVQMEADLTEVLQRAERNGQVAALLFIDLDLFKQVNDTLGHPVGDRLLQVVAGRLQHCLRSGDSVARIGGDEFVICLPVVRSSDEAALVASKVLDAIGRMVVVDGHELQIGASIGIALYPTDGANAAMMMRAADVAMYHAKENGRGNYCFFSAALDAVAARHSRLLHRLKRALPQQEFTLRYQPQVDIASGRIFGAEALLRWHPPGGEVVLPSEFIPLAEKYGIIVPIGEWVLREACTQLRCWRDAGHSQLRMSVNLSVAQVQQPGFEVSVDKILSDTGLPAAAVDLEITESVLMQPDEANLAVLGALNAMGTHLSMDDFGTGYSNLAYLRGFPIDALKIDQSFVRGIGHSEIDEQIIDTVVAISRCLHMQVIAEGVETAAQARFLLQHGCQAAQGYYFGEPLSADDFAQRLAAD